MAAELTLLRLAAAGSVDDGKSTLIGRLLYDSKTLFDDQLAAVERTSRDRGEDFTNLALLTDGLRAEREQGITIDVAYRHFATPRRRFIIADTPGHVQYTRNMVTGASTADLAIILVDARKGVLEQTRRHAFMASLLGVPHLLLCVNKMDLVGWSQDRFNETCSEFRRFATKLDVHDLEFVPVSALHGDNVVSRSPNMPWYEGPSVLHHLEEMHVASDRNLIDVRFPVQYVIRRHEFRGYAGTVAGGVLRTGDNVVILPSGLTSMIKKIFEPGGTPVTATFPPQAVVVQLADELDVGRGDLICRPGNQPDVAHEVDALVCWLSGRSKLESGRRYMMQHTTHSMKIHVFKLDYRLDVNTLHRDDTATSLSLNEIGRIRLHAPQPILFDSYRRNRATGSFILIDETNYGTVAAGMIIGPHRPSQTAEPHPESDNHADTAQGATIWLTSQSALDRSTIATELKHQLVRAGRAAYVINGNSLTQGVNADLGISPGDRSEYVRRACEVACLMAHAGVVAVVSLTSPYRADRDLGRAIHREAGLRFIEAFVDPQRAICQDDDPRGAEARATSRGFMDLTGVDADYEPPQAADIVVSTTDGHVNDAATKIRDLLFADA